MNSHYTIGVFFLRPGHIQYIVQGWAWLGTSLRADEYSSQLRCNILIEQSRVVLTKWNKSSYAIAHTYICTYI